MPDPREPFDDFLKRKYDNKDFGFKEEYWLEAEKLLEKKKRSKGFFWIFIFVGFASGIGTWMLMRDSNNNIQSEKITSGNKLPTITKPEIKNETTNNNSSNNPSNNEIKENNVPILYQKNTSKKYFMDDYKEYQNNIQAKEAAIPNTASIKQSEKVIMNTEIEKAFVKKVPDVVEDFQSKKNQNKIDSVFLQKEKNTDTLSPGKRWIGLYAGATCDAGISHKPNVSISCGINFEKNLKPNFMLGIGILYYNSGNIDISKVYNAQSYNFGITNYTNTVTTNRLDYISFPFYYKGRINKNNWLKVGASLSFLIYTKNNIVTQVQQDFETPAIVKYSEPNHKTGLTLFDPQFFGSYQYQFKKRWSMELKYFFGVVPVASKTHFGVQQENIYNRGFNLYIHYNFLNY
ncbi:MAG: hypothetical protein SGJ10_13840 [Bacteroidota bacterium]|nr:hypothetical protein [Bacteroidota bacterium]